MTYSVLKSFSCPKPGVSKPPGPAQLQPKDEMSPAPGAVVDLGHLDPGAIAFLTAEGCIEPAPEQTKSTTSTKGEK